MRIWEILTEGRDAPLYHWMDGHKALQVFSVDALLPKFAHKIIGTEQGISLTRNKNYNHFNGSSACLVFDQTKLAQTHRIVPVDAERAAATDRGEKADLDKFHDRPAHSYYDGSGRFGNEMAEEFLLGAIKPLHTYLTAIYVRCRDDEEFLKDAVVYGRRFGIPLKALDNPEYFQSEYADHAEEWHNAWKANHRRRSASLIESSDNSGVVLYHGTSEASEKMRLEGLKVGRLDAVYLTDNPQLAIEYAESDQDRTGFDNITIVSVRADQLDPSLLRGDIDHTLSDDWQESLRETDQCMYMGDIPPHLLTVQEY